MLVKALMPGVIHSLTLFVEHPELVAQRIVQYASIVGRENVIAGTDCGFGTGAVVNPRVHPEVVLAQVPQHGRRCPHGVEAALELTGPRAILVSRQISFGSSPPQDLLIPDQPSRI